jgi:ferredoxin-NADP reductase
VTDEFLKKQSSAAGRDGEVVVVAKHPESATVVTLELVPPRAEELPPWEPGAHIDLLLPNGLVRQYSLCGDPSDRSRWRVGVLREPESRGGSAHLHDVLRVGDRLPVRGPRNNFALTDADRYLFIAGGIGITPLLPMVARLAEEGRPWTLVYGGRSRDSMAFLGELANYGERVSLRPQDEEGLLDVEGLMSTAATGTAVYCCGPSGLITAVEEAAALRPEVRLYTERFSGDVLFTPEAELGFDVVLRRSGQVLRVPPERTVLDVLLDAGVDVESSCEEGVCGTCETPVLAGRIDHRDHILTAGARALGNVMYVCVSRGLDERLELDL